MDVPQLLRLVRFSARPIDPLRSSLQAMAAAPTKPSGPLARRPDDAWWSEAVGPLPTPNSILAAGRLQLLVVCKACDREAEANLRAIAAAVTCRCATCGFGALPVTAPGQSRRSWRGSERAGGRLTCPGRLDITL